MKDIYIETSIKVRAYNGIFNILDIRDVFTYALLSQLDLNNFIKYLFKNKYLLLL